MAVRIDYSLSQARVTPNDLISYDKREKRGDVNTILARATPETLVSPANDSLLFTSHEIRRAVDLYSEEFCLHVEDTLTAFWGARQGLTGLGLPIWLQTSSHPTPIQLLKVQWAKRSLAILWSVYSRLVFTIGP